MLFTKLHSVLLPWFMYGRNLHVSGQCKSCVMLMRGTGTEDFANDASFAMRHGHKFEQALGDGEGHGSLVCCSPWGRKESDTAERLNCLTEALILQNIFC